MFLVWQQPLVAVVISVKAKEEASGHKEHERLHKEEVGVDCGSTSTVQGG